jgi:hypothetical protein
MARDLGDECGVENRMGETASVIRPAMGVRHQARNGSGPQWDRVGPLFLNALRCDFDDASSCRINHGERVVQESAAGKLDRSRRHRQQALAAPVFSSMAGAIEVFC